jgi:hypothetical protein
MSWTQLYNTGAYGNADVFPPHFGWLLCPSRLHGSYLHLFMMRRKDGLPVWPSIIEHFTEELPMSIPGKDIIYFLIVNAEL